MGETVGPALQDNLQKLMPGQFMYQGVTYSADVAGDIELGAPGGKVATGVINDCFAKCPKTQMFVSGYSEGAMVAHDGVGGASAAAKANVAVSFPFLLLALHQEKSLT
jgi:cutinase